MVLSVSRVYIREATGDTARSCTDSKKAKNKICGRATTLQFSMLSATVYCSLARERLWSVLPPGSSYYVYGLYIIIKIILDYYYYYY